MKEIYKTKAQLRAESEEQIADFLRRGGVIEVSTRKAKAPASKMRAKSSRGFISGSSGFAAGFPRRSI